MVREALQAHNISPDGDGNPGVFPTQSLSQWALLIQSKVKNPKYQHMLGADLLEKDLGVLVNDQLTMS